MTEHGWLARLPAVVGPASDRVRVGIGDDAAILSLGDGDAVLTVDASVEGVHFDRAWLSLEDVGFRATMAAASDVAAMGGAPVALLSAVTVPPAMSEAELDALLAGQREAAVALAAPLVGGNLSRAPVLSIATTVIGTVRHPLLRRGARPGERVYLAGPVGLAAAGMRALAAGVSGDDASAACVAAFRRPVARIADGLAVAARASSCIDVSDGLRADALHVARASGVTLRIDAGAVLRASGPALPSAARRLGLDPLALALGGGEDYALVVTSAHDLGDAGLVAIGAVEAGAPDVVVVQDGRVVPPVEGYDHLG